MPSMIKSKLIMIMMLFCSVSAFAQINYEYLTGANEKALDTLALQNAKAISEETIGVLEKEIDPSKYIVGPGDEFEISILLGLEETIQYDTKVSPSGKIMLSQAGSVDVKEMTLLDAEKAIKEQIKKIFSNDNIYVVLSEIRKLKVTVAGAVSKPISVDATAADRVSEVIERAGGVKYDASQRKIVLRRNYKGKDTLINVDLVRFFTLGDKDANPFVLGGDIITIPLSSEKDAIKIFGDVNSPGEFEFVEGDSLSTLVGFGQGFLNSAILDSVEIARFDDSGLIIDRQFIDLSSWEGTTDFLNTRGFKNNFRLKSGDRVYIRTTPDWNDMDYVVIEGEVKYPGKYAINENTERIADLIDRAGGLTSIASAKDMEFIRQKEKKIKDLDLERLLAIPWNERSISEQRYTSARSNEKKGAMAIDLEQALLDNKSIDNVYLMHQDSIIIPQKIDYIKILGRVQNPGIITYQDNLTYLDYIEIAGGYGYRADESETFITKTNGEFVLARKSDYVLEPGDMILVPSKKEYDFMEGMTLWITIIGQAASIAGVVMALTR